MFLKTHQGTNIQDTSNNITDINWLIGMLFKDAAGLHSV